MSASSIFGEDSGIQRRRHASSAPARSSTCRSASGLLGRVVDALGNPIDGKGPLTDVDRARRVEVKAPGIIPRQSVHEPVQTGLKAHRRAGADRPRPARADHRRPPDRQDRASRSTPSSTRSRSTPAPTRSSKLYCIYVAIGQKRSTVAQIVKTLAGLRRAGIHRSSSPRPPPSRRRCSILAPYSGCAMGEYLPRQRHARGDRSTTICRSRPSPTARCRCCCAARRAAKPIPATCSICTRACSSAPPR